MSVTASSEMTRMHELSAQQGRQITELKAEVERLREALQEIADGKHEAMLLSNPPKNGATEYAKVVLEGGDEGG